MVEMIVALDIQFRSDIVPLYREADELLAIIIASIGTVRRKLKVSASSK